MIAPEPCGPGLRPDLRAPRSLVPAGSSVLADPEAEALVRSSLLAAAPHLESAGITVPRLEGRLLRPTLALRFVHPEHRETLPLAFWFGCWAIQMVHEASLLHDDVLDGGETRRGRATLLASAGRAASLLHGDVYLTGAYVVANRVGKPRFMSRFVRAVQDTVRGELLQAKSPSDATWRDVLPLKTGALFGLSASLASEWGGELDAGLAYEMGTDLGVLYQRVDDFLDYCPLAETGKPALQDFRKGVRTWMVPEPALDWFRQSPKQLESGSVRRRSGVVGPSPTGPPRERRGPLVRSRGSTGAGPEPRLPTPALGGSVSSCGRPGGGSTRAVRGARHRHVRYGRPQDQGPGRIRRALHGWAG